MVCEFSRHDVAPSSVPHPGMLSGTAEFSEARGSSRQMGPPLPLPVVGRFGLPTLFSCLNSWEVRRACCSVPTRDRARSPSQVVSQTSAGHHRDFFGSAQLRLATLETARRHFYALCLGVRVRAFL